MRSLVLVNQSTKAACASTKLLALAVRSRLTLNR
jgi:hypothetical protein